MDGRQTATSAGFWDPIPGFKDPRSNSPDPKSARTPNKLQTLVGHKHTSKASAMHSGWDGAVDWVGRTDTTCSNEL